MFFFSFFYFRHWFWLFGEDWNDFKVLDESAVLNNLLRALQSTLFDLDLHAVDKQPSRQVSHLVESFHNCRTCLLSIPFFTSIE